MPLIQFRKDSENFSPNSTPDNSFRLIREQENREMEEYHPTEDDIPVEEEEIEIIDEKNEEFVNKEESEAYDEEEIYEEGSEIAVNPEVPLEGVEEKDIYPEERFSQDVDEEHQEVIPEITENEGSEEQIESLE